MLEIKVGYTDICVLRPIVIARLVGYLANELSENGQTVIMFFKFKNNLAIISLFLLFFYCYRTSNKPTTVLNLSSNILDSFFKVPFSKESNNLHPKHK